jgi:hypothetical protein
LVCSSKIRQKSSIRSELLPLHPFVEFKKSKKGQEMVQKIKMVQKTKTELLQLVTAFS